jgi:hypothetical protein
MRRDAADMERPTKYNRNPQRLFQNRVLMPSIPEGTPLAKQYDELHKRTGNWLTSTRSKIDALSDPEMKKTTMDLLEASQKANEM